VQAFKVGQRDMNRYASDIKAIRDADPSKAILTCHDEYLLATMVQGVDGALVGFATFIPGLINDLWESVKAGDLNRAMKIQNVITPLKDAVYGGGEPTGEAHARMKAGMYLAGVIDDPTVRGNSSVSVVTCDSSLRSTIRPIVELICSSSRHVSESSPLGNCASAESPRSSMGRCAKRQVRRACTG